jgi:transposase
MAVAHKMMRIVFIMLDKKEPYIDPDINYAEIVVHRNAPRWLRALENYGYLQHV